MPVAAAETTLGTVIITHSSGGIDFSGFSIRGWPKAEAARSMLVTPLTADSWNKRLDD